MDWKILGTTFLTIFLAEMGDKTQLGAFFIASGTTSRLSVFVGVSLALICATAIAVAAGEVVGRVVPAIWIQRIAGAMFIGLGALFIWGSVRA